MSDADDAPAAPARPPQRTIEDAIAEAEHLLQETFDRLDPDRYANEQYGWFVTRIAKIRDALADRPSGCRAAGAVTPPATVPNPSVAWNAIRSDKDMSSFGFFCAGWNARGGAAVGAGAATPALTPGAWVPVGERLPPYGELVLVASGSGIGTGQAAPRDYALLMEWAMCEPFVNECPITHWMPLPAPPADAGGVAVAPSPAATPSALAEEPK